MKPKRIMASTLMRAFVPNRHLGSGRIAALTASGCVSILLFLLAGNVCWAQTVRFRAAQLRITVPPNATTTTLITNLVTVSDDVASPVVLDVTGLPAGAGYTLSTNNFTNTVELSLTVDATNIPQGEYVFSLNATGGATNNLLFVLQSGHVWNGSTNAAADGAGLWSNAAKWLGGVPGALDDVIFTDLGGQTNSIVVTPSATNLLVSSVIDNDFTIGSLRFAQTNSDTAIHTLQINSGRTLSVLGTNGFRFLRDYINEVAAIGQTMSLVITGAGRLVLSNQNANLALTVDGQLGNTLDMAGLNNFSATVNRIGFGDYSLYPNFWNLDANQYNGVPRRFIPSINFARTNIIRANYVDPNSYTNADDRLYSLTFVNSVYSGTTAIPIWNLGFTNAFLMDSVCLVGANQQGRVQFNPTVTNGFALFRNTNGTRMTMFAVSDDAGTNYSGSNIKSFLDFGNNGGTLDVLTEKFIMTRDRKLLSSDGNFQGQLYFGKGIIDANSAILGFQQFTNRSTNAGVYRGYCQASVTVSNTAVFKVNDTLELGYATETDPNSEPAENRGVLNIGPGGTARANRILFGGPTKISASSAINMSGGGTLIVSNNIAGADGKLPSLTMSDSVLTLHVNASNSTPYVYVTNLITSGITNLINIASILNVASYPTQLALISYESASATFSAKLPAGQFGFVLNNSLNKTIDLYLFTNAPNTVLWRGNVNGNWDTTTLNWVDPVSLAPTNFQHGDFTIFDDTAVATSINVVDGVFPGQSGTVAGVTVSNATKNFTFSGGPISGTAKMVKLGAAKLTIENISENTLAITNGTVEIALSGSVGITTVAPGTTFNLLGTASGLTSFGSSSNAGNIFGPVAINGGAFNNSGNVNTRPGTMSVTNAVVTNLASGVLNVFVASGNNWGVNSNSVLANFGRIVNLNQRLNINAGALLFGTGTLSRDTGVTVDNGRLAINQGAVFAPGGSPVNSIGTFTVEARLDINQAAGGVPAGRLLIEVDMNNPGINDRVAVDKWSNIRGTVVMTNIGSVPFAAAQSFLISTNNFGVPNLPEIANLDYTFQPVTPGVGLAWDSVGGTTTAGGVNFITNGIVGIKAVATVPTNITVSITTNLWAISWPSEYTGWRLEGQTNTLANGISNNWNTVLNSQATNRVFIRVSPANGTVFFRMAHP
jgi:hypothetical protein